MNDIFGMKKGYTIFFINAAKLGHIGFNLIIVILQNIKAQILLIEYQKYHSCYCNTVCFNLCFTSLIQNHSTKITISMSKWFQCVMINFSTNSNYILLLLLRSKIFFKCVYSKITHWLRFVLKRGWIWNKLKT